MRFEHELEQGLATYHHGNTNEGGGGKGKVLVLVDAFVDGIVVDAGGASSGTAVLDGVGALPALSVGLSCTVSIRGRPGQRQNKGLRGPSPGASRLPPSRSRVPVVVVSAGSGRVGRSSLLVEHAGALWGRIGKKCLPFLWIFATFSARPVSGRGWG